MQLSYAQRLEDYHLDLAFGDQRSGTYIDVGAGHPVADNVSYWFYLKGWRGLVIEPQRQLLDLYAHLRPRDIAIGSLVGDRNGEADFHVVERLHGFSTTIAEQAQTAKGFGASVETVRMPMRTLASLIKEHELGRVDFLKIDVEGAEAAVLAGMDWGFCRPRIVVVEATTPGSMAAAWREWEPALLAEGYRFRLYDELNRFYVAEEEIELFECLPSSPVEWNSAAHLYDYGRAHERKDHPDHLLATQFVRGFLACLPKFDPAFLAELLSVGDTSEKSESSVSERIMRILLGTAEFPGHFSVPQNVREKDGTSPYIQLMNSDRFRAALGRIAAAYDGGHIME